MTRWRAGVDSGGTFTDVCLLNEGDGSIVVWKVPSTPANPANAILRGVREGFDIVSGQTPDSHLAYFGHGTTVATNALIQQRGVKSALITTRGFKDILELARQRRPHLYDLQCDKPFCLVQRDLRLEAAERIRHDGSIETPLDEAEVRALAKICRDENVKAIAVCFLHSYKNPEHEIRATQILKEECPDAFITASHEIAPEFREYERFSTAAVNVYLGPIMKAYLDDLEPRLSQIGIASRPHITQSNGGTLSFATAAKEPVRTLLSGPATGVTGAQAVADAAGIANFVTFDMGGTSSDVALIEEAQAKLTPHGSIHGYPLKVPMLDIHTIGAGGGSIAYVDAGGLLKVGPDSAGAVPGPVCYGLGGTQPTVCDANVVLRTLDAKAMLGGRMAVDEKLAFQAIEKLAAEMKLGVLETAQGIISVVVANMARAIRLISVQRGRDPRDFTLMAFGGAGPLHAARLMKELEMPRVLVPRYPGLLCAMGLLMADLKRNDSITNHMIVTPDSNDVVEKTFENLKERADRWFDDEEIPQQNRIIVRSVDARYKGQSHELNLALPDSAKTADLHNVIRSLFDAEHQKVYGYTAPEYQIELITFRTEATAVVQKATIPASAPAASSIDEARLGERKVWLPEVGDFAALPVLAREKLGSGHRITGPAIIQQMDSTTVVLPQMTATVDPHLNLILEAKK
ncbi:MAG: hydantoinase/oxoprolinase family protein [Pseudorhodoplanes sp.]